MGVIFIIVPAVGSQLGVPAVCVPAVGFAVVGGLIAWRPVEEGSCPSGSPLAVFGSVLPEPFATGVRPVLATAGWTGGWPFSHED